MEAAGHPRDQSIAAALKTAGLSNKNAEGSRGRMSGATIFASGEHRGRPWTHADIDQIVHNFKQFSTGDDPAHAAPCVKGHEEQDFSDRTDLPAEGWNKKVWREDEPCPECKGEGCKDCFGTGKRALLKSDIDEIPLEMQAELDAGKYRYPSAEIYDSPEMAGLRGEGPMLRRTAFLGAEPPQVKRLGRLPPVERYAESWPVRYRVADVRRTSAGTWQCFSEYTPMQAHEVRAKLAAAGVPDYELAALSDIGLAGLVKFAEEMPHPGKVEGPPGRPDAPLTSQTDASATPPMPPTRKEESWQGKFAEMPDEDWDKTDPGMMNPEDKKAAHAYACRMYGESFGTEFAEKWAGRVRRYSDMGTVPGSTLGLVKTSQTPPPERYAEVERIAKHAEQTAKRAAEKAEAAERFSEERLDKELRRSISARLDDLQRKGKVLPFERQGGVASAFSLDSKLAKCNAVKVNTFAENGKTLHMTELEYEFELLNRRPAEAFGERMVAADPLIPLSQQDADAEKERIRRHWRDNAKTFTKVGMSLEKFSEAFDARRSHEPGLTAEQFLGAGRK